MSIFQQLQDGFVLFWYHDECNTCEITVEVLESVCMSLSHSKRRNVDGIQQKIEFNMSLSAELEIFSLGRKVTLKR